jgi:hypothetical protein
MQKIVEPSNFNEQKKGKKICKKFKKNLHEKKILYFMRLYFFFFLKNHGKSFPLFNFSGSLNNNAYIEKNAKKKEVYVSTELFMWYPES